MNETVGGLDIECFARGTNIALVIAVGFDLFIKVCDEHVAAYIEFAGVIEERNQIFL